MRARPARLNAAIAWLFMVGSACFAVGSVPAYLDVVGTRADSVTFFVGSLFFTTASFAQLVQAQSPAMTTVDARSQDVPARVRLTAWLPHQRAWLGAVTQFPGTLCFNVSTFAALAHNLTVAEQDRHVWRPDFYGSTLFLVASAYGILAASGRFLSVRPRSLSWWIAWLNMLGSVFFMASAIASYVVPATGDLASSAVATAGTFLGAVCFLVGAALMLPAWRRALMPARPVGAS